MEASNVLETIVRRKWAIMLTALACAVAAAGFAWASGRQYTATVTLRVRAQDFLSPVGENFNIREETDPEAMPPEAQQAQTVALVKTVDALVKNPVVLTPVIERLRLQMTTAQLQSRIQVKEISPVLVQVAVSALGRENARALANELTAEFLTNYTRLRAEEVRKDLAALQQQVDLSKAELEQYAKQTGRAPALRARIAEENYTALVRRLQRLRGAEAMLSQGTAVGVVDPVGPANQPLDTTGGQTMKLGLAGLILGGLAAACLMVLLEAMDRRVRTARDAEALFGKPVMAVVPRAPKGPALGRAVADQPGSALSQSFHILALHLQNQALGQRRVLAALAARPGQGATMVMSNLAIALAQSGKRVVLVDADLRNPGLHGLFDLPSGPGLAETLSAPDSGASMPDMVRATSVPNLSLLAAGEGGAAAVDAGHLSRIGSLLQRLAASADVVVLNLPPAAQWPEAFQLVRHSDAALVVLRAGESAAAPEIALQEGIGAAGVPVIGVVLNDVPPEDLVKARTSVRPRENAVPDSSRPAFAVAE